MLAIAALLRVSEALALKVGDLTFGCVACDHVDVKIQRSKTDQFGIGAVVRVECIRRKKEDCGDLACAVHAAATRLTRSKPTESFLLGGAAQVTYEVCRTRFLKILPKASGVGTHSWRRSGAVRLFRAGILLDNIKLYGRWRSDAVLTYL